MFIRPRWDSSSYLQYLVIGLFPVISEIPADTRFKIPQHLWPEIAEQHKTILERLAAGDISRRRAAKELGIGYAKLKRLLDAN